MQATLKALPARSDHRLLDKPPRRPASSRPLWLQRQGKAEGGARSLVLSCPETPAMDFDDGTANRQTHSHSAVFRGEERVEDGRWIRNAATGVADLNQDAGALLPGNQRQ